MDELIYILKVVLKRLPYQNFMREGKEAAINISMDILAKEIHKYMANHSDTETGNILESVQSSFEEYEKTCFITTCFSNTDICNARCLCSRER